ncbi:polysaccharide deacetylase family protein [Streptomyces sp. TS71-3]|uniref:polysaccharide deacetylase family protein n=1 Tax=Streptomyces sp. TS71-3 TaxID=2733862 RepID=UPI001B1A8328|nr:polysaccharide deacetylase family protein [Streptomyces sp. TS71-3]GHJ39989.1 polysaccharide deacetylase [Streptomyces sp. TS71-3]
MYHSVHALADRREDPYRITVTPARLDAQLGLLRRHGSRGVSVAELLAARAAGRDRNLVGLTFDDGYQDFVEQALPLLRKHACTATVFVLPGRLGGVNAWDEEGPRKPLLDADGIRRAADAGMEIASHGLTHTDLARADEALRHAELVHSRALLAELTGREVRGFCYPYGAVDPDTADAVRRAGYSYGCAIAPGPLAGVFALPRVYVGRRDTALRLTAKRLLAPLRRPLPAVTPGTARPDAANASVPAPLLPPAHTVEAP